MRRFHVSFFVILLALQSAMFAATAARVKVGNGPDFLAVNSVTNQIYVANSSDGTVSVIDGVTNTVTDTISVGSQPQGVGVNTATNTIYVALFAGLSSTVAVIDGATNTVVTDVSVPGATYIGVNSKTNQVFVSDSDNTVRVIDGGTNTVVATIEFSQGLESIAVDQQRNLAYVAEVGAVGVPPSIGVIDGANDTLVHSFPLTGAQFIPGLAVDPSLNQLYATDSLAERLYIINAGTRSLVKTLNIRSSNMKYVTVGTAHKVWAADPNGNQIFRIDGVTGTLVATYRVDKGPWGMAVNLANDNIYIPLSLTDAIWAVTP